MSAVQRLDPPGYLPAFCLHFLLPNTLLVVLALTAGAIGGEYGVPYLVWHDEPIKQFWVGFAMALVSLQALYIGLLLWGKKAGRPDRLMLCPQLIDRVNSGLFTKYCLWVVGQLCILVAVLGVLVLLVQFIDARTLPTGPAQIAEEKNNVPPPRPNFAPWLPLGGLTAAAAVFIGGWLAKGLIHLLSKPAEPNAPRRLMSWLIDATEDLPPAPTRAGLILALWSARTQGSRLRRMWVALFNQTLCVSVGVVFAAVWDLSRIGVAIGISAAMLFGLVAVRARWLNDTRVFRGFLVLLGCLAYFVVTWLGSRPWCGWPGAFAIAAFLAAVLPIGARYAFPVATAQLLRRTNERIIDPSLCRRYPFHSVAVLFFAFGVVTLFVLPMVFNDVRSPMVLGCFLAFMFLSLYGFVAYVIDDALPYLAPVLLGMFVLSGMPQYKMQFPGLEYRGQSEDGVPAGLLDLEATVQEDRQRKREFDEALNRTILARVSLVAGGLAHDREPWVRGEVGEKWRRLETENRILPGKDNRPGLGQPSPGRLITLPDIAFNAVPATINAGGAAHGAEVLRLPLQRKPMVVVVASGGGVRAAAWTLLVLSELEARFAAEGIPFPYHVRLITGASGGMFGASYYVRSLRAPNEMSWGDERRSEMTTRFDKLTQDWLTPIVESLVTNDVPGFFSPFPSPTDRGVALEKAWSKGLDGELDMTFDQLAERERAGWCPSLVFSPMMIEDGRRLLISNLDMRYPVSNDGHMLDPDDKVLPALAELNRNYSHEAMELFRMFPQARGRFALSTAVRMSASFPYFSPAVPLPTKPRRRVVDAGYFDNYGVSLAASYLFSKKNTEWFKANVSKIVLIQIRDGQSEDERRLEEIPDARRQKGSGSMLSRSLEELTSPIEGLNNGRVGTCSFRNDGLLELLSTYYEQMRQEPGSGKIPQVRRFFTVVNFEFPGHVALSWHLAKGEKNQMRETFLNPKDNERARALHAKIDALVEWWKADVYEPPSPADELRTKVRVAADR
jgi:predicted acylesterase/phospholipase RssA